MTMHVDSLSDRQIDWLTMQLLGNQAQPASCSACPFFSERAGVDDPIYECRFHHTDLTYSDVDMDTGWKGIPGPIYGVHPQCPLKKGVPPPYTTDWRAAIDVFHLIKLGFSWNPTSKQWEGHCDGTTVIGKSQLHSAFKAFVVSRYGWMPTLNIPEEFK